MTTKTDPHTDPELTEQETTAAGADPQAADTDDGAQGPTPDPADPATEAAADAQATEDDAEDEDDDAELLDAAGDTAAAGPSGVGQGAAAIVATGLGLVSLSGGWLGTIAGARETLTGQLTLSTNSNPGIAAQVKEGYTDGWHATAAVGGIFALIALIVGVAVLARPAFGAPGRTQPGWIKSVAWAGVSLGVIGLILAVAKYTDLILGTPALS